MKKIIVVLMICLMSLSFVYARNRESLILGFGYDRLKNTEDGISLTLSGLNISLDAQLKFNPASKWGMFLDTDYSFLKKADINGLEISLKDLVDMSFMIQMGLGPIREFDFGKDLKLFVGPGLNAFVYYFIPSSYYVDSEIIWNLGFEGYADLQYSINPNFFIDLSVKDTIYFIESKNPNNFGVSLGMGIRY